MLCLVDGVQGMTDDRLCCALGQLRDAIGGKPSLADVRAVSHSVLTPGSSLPSTPLSMTITILLD